MPTKTEIESYITETAASLGHFQSPTPELATSPTLEHLIEAGYALLGYYEENDDTLVNDAVVGSLVDAAVALTMLDPNTLSPEAHERATEMTAALEELVNAITAAVERNIAASR